MLSQTSQPPRWSVELPILIKRYPRCEAKREVKISDGEVW